MPFYEGAEGATPHPFVRFPIYILNKSFTASSQELEVYITNFVLLDCYCTFPVKSFPLASYVSFDLAVKQQLFSNVNTALAFVRLSVMSSSCNLISFSLSLLSFSS